MRSCLLIPLLHTLAALPALAATRTWDAGDASPNWSAQNNWNGNTPIAAADTLVFPAGLPVADRTSTNNFPAATLWDTISINDTFTLNGTPPACTKATIASSGTVTINSGFSPQTRVHLTSGNAVFAPGSVLTTYTGEFASSTQLIAELPGSTFTMNGLITGGAGTSLDLTGPGRFEFNTPNSFQTPVFLSGGGTLVLRHSEALGKHDSDNSIVESTLQISSASPLTFHEGFALVASDGTEAVLRSDSGNHTIAGFFSPRGGGAKIVDVNSGSLSLAGSIGIVGLISNVGPLIKRGAAPLTIGGSAPNSTLPAYVRVEEGPLFLSKPAGVPAIIGINDLDEYCTLQAGNSSGIVQDAEIRLMNSEQIDDESVIVSVFSDGLFNLNGHNETILELSVEPPGRVTTGAGTLRINGPLTVPDLTNDNTSSALITGRVVSGPASAVWLVDQQVTGGFGLTVNGPLSFAAPDSVIRKRGPGGLALAGNHGSGKLLVEEGDVRLTGDSPGLDLEFIANLNSSVLYATGRLGVLEFHDDHLSPGTAPATIGTLECQSLIFEGNTSMNIDYLHPGNGGFDVVKVNGLISMSAFYPEIRLLPGWTQPALGTEIVVVAHDGVDKIYGHLNGYPEGSILTDNQQLTHWYVSYHGGDGNDMSLTYIVPPTGTTRTWDGGSAVNSSWSTPENWVGDIAPQPGDNLVFPAVAARKTNTNNLPAGTTFHSVTIAAGDYTIGGNSVILNEGLTSTHASPGQTAQWNVPLTFALNTGVTCGTGALRCGGAITLAGRTLHFEKAPGTAALSFTGPITGTGEIHKTGDGTVIFSGADKQYFGPTIVATGALEIQGQQQLGENSADTRILAGAELRINAPSAPFVLTEPLTTAGAIRVVSPAGAVFANTVAGLPDAEEARFIAETPCTISSTFAFSPATRVIKSGPSSLRLQDGSPATTVDDFRIHEGSLILARTLPSLGANWTIGDPYHPPVAAQLILGASHQLADDSSVLLLHSLCTFDAAGFTDTLYNISALGGAITGQATSRLSLYSLSIYGASGTVTVGAPLAAVGPGPGVLSINDGTAATDVLFTAPLYGTTFRKTGPGRADFMAAIPQGGIQTLSIESGSALFFQNCRYTNIELSGGLLGGNGTVGNIESVTGGTISPGASPGALGGYKATWDHATTLRMELNGLTPGSEYDQYVASLPPDLGGATLALTTGFDPAPGDSFMIVRNISGSPVTGQFANAPEGGHVSAPGGRVFQITYTGGDGDDVMLTRVLTDAPQIVEWSLVPPAVPGENPTAHFVFQGLPGLTYTLQSSTDLQKWQDEKSEVAAFPSGLIQMDLEEPAADPRKFFRLILP